MIKTLVDDLLGNGDDDPKSSDNPPSTRKLLEKVNDTNMDVQKRVELAADVAKRNSATINVPLKDGNLIEVDEHGRVARHEMKPTLSTGITDTVDVTSMGHTTKTYIDSGATSNNSPDQTSQQTPQPEIIDVLVADIQEVTHPTTRSLAFTARVRPRNETIRFTIDVPDHPPTMSATPVSHLEVVIRNNDKYHLVQQLELGAHVGYVLDTSRRVTRDAREFTVKGRFKS